MMQEVSTLLCLHSSQGREMNADAFFVLVVISRYNF